MLKATILCVVAVAMVAYALPTALGPLHAECRMSLTFGIPCSQVSAKLVSQIKAWNGPAGCANGGEKCLYSLTSVSPNKLEATHETPTHHYVDALTLTFTSPTSVACNVDAFSSSKVVYAVLDDGTNYCNIFNLLEASGLTTVPGFTLTTSDKICTQYSTANCTIY